MTTHTHLSDSPQVVPTMAKSRKNLIPWVVLAFALIVLAGIIFAVTPTLGSTTENNMKFLTAVSSRYQGQADSYSAMMELNSEKALESISARYQGQADLIAAKRQSDSQKALESISAHYQGLADLYLGID
mgnify:FL=1